MGHPGRLHLRSIDKLRPTWLCPKKGFPKIRSGDLRTKDPILSVGSMSPCRIQGSRIRVDRSGIGFSLVPDFAAESPDLADLMKNLLR